MVEVGFGAPRGLAERVRAAHRRRRGPAGGRVGGALLGIRGVKSNAKVSMKTELTSALVAGPDATIERPGRGGRPAGRGTHHDAHHVAGRGGRHGHRPTGAERVTAGRSAQADLLRLLLREDAARGSMRGFAPSRTTSAVTTTSPTVSSEGNFEEQAVTCEYGCVERSHASQLDAELTVSHGDALTSGTPDGPPSIGSLHH